LALAGQSGAAQNKERELLPIAEGRAAMEFDLARISPKRIQSATLKIESRGTGILPGTLTIPVEVRGYLGDGSITTDDFNAGSVITSFDSLATPDNTPIFIDVTEFLRGMRPGKSRIAGFTLSSDVHGVQINYGSLELGTAPSLIITLK
jgi:hypothetical protein